MAVYIFKISPISDKEVYREIQIPTNYSFEDFHHSILDAFEIQPGEMASFYTADEQFSKGLEITLMDMNVNEDEAVNLLMKDVPLDRIIKEKIFHFVYDYDFLFLKSFHVHLSKIVENRDDDVVLLVDSKGKYKVDQSQFTDFLMEDLDGLDGFSGYDGMDDELDDKKSKKSGWEDDFGDDDFDDDEPTFENIDDLDL